MTLPFKLVSESNGIIKVKRYKEGNYTIRQVFDGVDTSISVYHEDGAMPSLIKENSASMLNFPIRSYRIEDADKLVRTVTELCELEKKMNDRC